MAHAIKDKFKLALAQLNPVVGDIEGNAEKAREARARAADAGADLVAFTELYLTGYPIEDLVLKPALQQAAQAALESLARDTKDGGPAMLMGLPFADGPFVYNARRCWIEGASRRSASRTICRIMACSTRSGCSRRGRCPRRSTFAASSSACRCARISGARRCAGRWPARVRTC